jgi:hypothetical protein
MAADVLPIKGHRGYERKVRQSAAAVLRDCRARHPTDVLVMGYDAEGRFFVQGAPPDPGQALWLMELAKKMLLGLG